MRHLILILIAVALVIPSFLGCGKSEQVVTYEGPAVDAPQPKGMARKGLEARKKSADGEDSESSGSAE